MPSTSGGHRMLAVLFLAVAGAAPPGERSLGDLSGPWQLFVDDSLVAEKSGVRRTYHPFRKHPANPVLRGGKEAWEGDGALLYGTVLPTEDRRGYRLWYFVSHPEMHDLPKRVYGGSLHYATSRDGLHWTKPALGLVDFGGTRSHNIFFKRSPEDHIPSVIHTPWDAAGAAYKLINYDYGRTEPGAPVSGFYGARSDDGVRWRDTGPNPVLPDAGDVGSFVWDPHGRRYVGYPKVFTTTRGFNRRAVGFTATSRFDAWPPAELILAPDPLDDRWVTAAGQHTDFYGLCGFAYEAGYIGFLWIFRITDGRSDGPIFVELVSSRDGIRWTRQEGDREPVLPCGKPGAWDAGMVYTASQPLVEGDTIKLYYSGTNTTHAVRDGRRRAIGLATLRKDGFASLDAGSAGGTVTTRLLRGARGPLRVNADARAGSIRVEVLDAAGRVVPGYGRQQCAPLEADGVDQQVRWGSRRMLPVSGRGLRLRFVLLGASLYSFAAGDGLRVDERGGTPEDLLFTFEGVPASGPAGLALGGGVRISDDPSQAASGTRALSFGNGSGSPETEIAGTAFLGHAFTLAVYVKPAGDRRMRLFSSYRGGGEPVTGELFLDVNPTTGTLRFVANGQTVTGRPRHLAGGSYHHAAATYDHGAVTLYLDGLEVGRGPIRPGTVRLFRDRSVIEHLAEPGARSLAGIVLARDLRLGGDETVPFSLLNARDPEPAQHRAQLIGFADDVLIARRALAGSEIAALAGRGGRVRP